MKNNLLDKLYKKEHLKDEENRIIIKMNVNDDSGFISEFSSSDIPVISPSVADFLENSTRSVLPKEQLALHVKSDCIDEKEKELYPKAIKEYYVQHLISTKKELRANNLIALFLAVAGIFVLTIALLLNYFIGVVWAEVIDIVAWVLLWEAVDIKFFKTRELSLKIKRYLAFTNIKVKFLNK